MTAPLRVLFAGTPEFAVPALRALVDAGYGVAGVLTQPDRPAGRGRHTLASPVKQYAEAASIPVWQPHTLRDRDLQESLRALVPDVLITAAYGLMLPPAVLQAPTLGCVNIHASLLPRWRGAAPIQRALAAGDAETGVTLIRMVRGLDAGPIIAQSRSTITADDTAGDLHERLAGLGAGLLVESLPAYALGQLATVAQNEAEVVYATKLAKAESYLDWSLPALALERQIRAFDPWPVARAQHGDTDLRIWRGQVERRAARAAPGNVEAIGEGIEVATGQGVLRLLSLQVPGRRRQAAAAFLNGYRLAPGDRLGPVSAGD